MPQIDLTAEKTGIGTGLVTSEPQGIDCGATCIASYDEGTEVTLTAAAESGSVFAGWSGYCSGIEPCVIRVEGVRSVIAMFLPEHQLNVDFTGSGSGQVTSVPAGLDCSDDCMSNYIEGTQLTLNAVADTGNQFIEWSGDCTCEGDCLVTMMVMDTAIYRNT